MRPPAWACAACGVRVRRLTSLVPSAAARHGLGGAHSGDDHWSRSADQSHTHTRACTHTHAHRSEGYSTDALQSISINNPSGGDYRIAVRTARRHPHGSAVAHRLLPHAACCRLHATVSAILSWGWLYAVSRPFLIRPASSFAAGATALRQHDGQHASATLWHSVCLPKVLIR